MIKIINYKVLIREALFKPVGFVPNEVAIELHRCIDALIESDLAKELLFLRYSGPESSGGVLPWEDVCERAQTRKKVPVAQKIVDTAISLLQVSHLLDIFDHYDSIEDKGLLYELQIYRPRAKVSSPSKILPASRQSSVGSIPQARSNYFNAAKSSFGRGLYIYGS